MSTVNKTIRIGLDCRLAGTRHAGIGRYTENLIQQLLDMTHANNLSQKITWVCFFSSRLQAETVLESRLQNNNLELVIAPIRHYSLSEQLKMPKIFKNAKLDILHIPHFNVPIFYQGKLVITIHDLLWHEQRGLQVTTLNPFKYFFKYLAYLFVSWQAIKKADRILVPSQSIKKTVLRYYPKVGQKIVQSKEGLAPAYLKEAKNKLLPHNGIKKQLVYTGSLYPHKNLALIIKALNKIPKYKLLIVGSRNVFRERVKKLISRYKVKQQVKFLGYQDDQALIKLYQQSFALVQPSLSEGFGLTGLEAIASKTLLLASDIEVFHEIYGQAAFYFDPKNVDSFLAALNQAELVSRKKQLRTALEIAKQYNWQELAQTSCKTYLELL